MTYHNCNLLQLDFGCLVFTNLSNPPIYTNRKLRPCCRSNHAVDLIVSLVLPGGLVKATLPLIEFNGFELASNLEFRESHRAVYPPQFTR